LFDVGKAFAVRPRSQIVVELDFFRLGGICHPGGA
jgi:hypothetical protein